MIRNVSVGHMLRYFLARCTFSTNKLDNFDIMFASISPYICETIKIKKQIHQY